MHIASSARSCSSRALSAWRCPFPDAACAPPVGGAAAPPLPRRRAWSVPDLRALDPAHHQRRIGVEPIGDLAHQLVADDRLPHRREHRDDLVERAVAPRRRAQVGVGEHRLAPGTPAGPPRRAPNQLRRQRSGGLRGRACPPGSSPGGIAATRSRILLRRPATALRAQHRVAPARSASIASTTSSAWPASSCSCSGVIAVPITATASSIPA